MRREKIGGLAKRTGCDIETIRYYEREGLIELPPRLPSGYRVYVLITSSSWCLYCIAAPWV